MTAGFGGDPIATNGTTPITAVSAPSSGRQREIYSCVGRNLDSIAHIFRVRINENGTIFQPYGDVTVSAGEAAQLVPFGSIVLNATTDTFEVVLGEAISTVQPKVIPAFFEVP